MVVAVHEATLLVCHLHEGSGLFVPRVCKWGVVCMYVQMAACASVCACMVEPL
jgi:hypothetical protein